MPLEITLFISLSVDGLMAISYSGVWWQFYRTLSIWNVFIQTFLTTCFRWSIQKWKGLCKIGLLSFAWCKSDSHLAYDNHITVRGKYLPPTTHRTLDEETWMKSHISNFHILNWFYDENDNNNLWIHLTELWSRDNVHTCSWTKMTFYAEKKNNWLLAIWLPCDIHI